MIFTLVFIGNNKLYKQQKIAMASQNPLSILDVVAIGIILLSAIWGIFRKLSRELFSLIAVLFSFVISLLTYRHIGEKLAGISRLDIRSAEAIAFATVAILTVCVMIVIKLVLGKVFTITVENKAERIGGFFVGLISSTLTVCMTFYLLILFPHKYLNRKIGAESIIGKTVKKCFPYLQKIETIHGTLETTEKTETDFHPTPKQKTRDTKQKTLIDNTSTNNWI